jgi:hypothetical protein
MSPTDELQRLCDALRAVRLYVQDCIETGHDRTMLGNLYSARDEIDAALAPYRLDADWAADNAPSDQGGHGKP